MKNKRKEKKLNKAERLARKKLIIETFFICCMSFSAILLFTSSWLTLYLKTPESTIYTFLNDFGYSLVILFIVYVLFVVVFWFVRKPAHIKTAYEKVGKTYSKRLAEKFLIPGKPTNVIITNTRNEVYKEYILGLHDICEFYAVLNIYDDTITIYSRFKDDTIDRFFDIITKEEFSMYCEPTDKPEE